MSRRRCLFLILVPAPLLFALATAAPAERAGWLGLVAAWQIKYCQNLEEGQKSLERLVREFPGSVQAFAARRRLELLARRLKQNAN